jgi:hypothetical protein
MEIASCVQALAFDRSATAFTLGLITIWEINPDSPLTSVAIAIIKSVQISGVDVTACVAFVATCCNIVSNIRISA